MIQLWTRTRMTLDMIKFEHTIFALPFALISMLLASKPALLPSGATIFWILVAMVGARSAAMSFNRLADAKIDSENPRTASRHIPSGLLDKGYVWGFFVISILLFEVAAWQLNRICFLLSPVALAAVLGYSYTKRFTALCHLILGFAIGIAPIGAWLAVRGELHPIPLLIGAIVMLWIGGFDIIYALQDYEFDRKSSLHSLPKWVGKGNALLISRIMHLLMLGLLIGLGVVANLHLPYYIGVAITAVLIVYEQSLVKPTDLSRVNLAFFTLNGWIGVCLFFAVLADCLLFH